MGLRGEEAGEVLSNWNAAFSTFIIPPGQGLHIPEPILKGVVLKASHALTAPHPSAQAGPATEWSQKVSGISQLQEPISWPVFICSKYLLYITLIRKDASLYF